MLDSTSPNVTSSAMRVLLAAVERECTSKFVPEAKQYLPNARLFMIVLDSWVNPSATMSEDQASSLANYIVDKWLPKSPDYTDALEPRMSIATFINSCQT